MEAEESAEDKVNSVIWRKTLSSYLTITELCRIRRVNSMFRDCVHDHLRDNSFRMVIRSDDEMGALHRIGSVPVIVRFETPRVTLAGLQNLLAGGTLQDVEVVDCDHMNDQALISMSGKSRYIRRILIDCRPTALAARNGYNGTRPMMVSDQAIKAIATACSDLEALELIWARQVTDDAFLEVFGRCPNLHIFRLHWSRISDKALQSIGPKENLRVLDIRTCKEVSDIGVRPVFQQCYNINEVYLVDVAITDHSLEELAKSGVARRLHTLFLSDLEHVTDAGLKALAGEISESLRVLHISHLKGVTNDGVAALLAAAYGLTDLSIAYVGISDDMMKKLANEPSPLPALKMARFDGLKDVTDNGLTSLARTCHNLHYIEVFNSKTTEICARSLRSQHLSVIMNAW